MPEARTVMQPGVVIDVPDDEYEVLRSGGLLATEPAPPAANAPTVRQAVQPAAAKSDTAPPADATTGADPTKKKG